MALAHMTFQQNFTDFAADAKLAFPEMTEIILRAQGIVDADPEKASKGFLAEVAATQEQPATNDTILENVKACSLLKGFCIPDDAPVENRCCTIMWVMTLIANGVQEAAMGDQPDAEQLPNMFDMLQSVAGANISSFIQPSGPPGAELLHIIQSSGLPEADLDGMSIEQMLSSDTGAKLTKEIGKSMGIEIDLTSPEAKEAMRMMERMLF